jgi:hypothetical protein
MSRWSVTPGNYCREIEDAKANGNIFDPGQDSNRGGTDDEYGMNVDTD